jgi:thiaminase/transcriptional activator TenA
MIEVEPLSRRLWQANDDLAGRCLEHPFVQRLADGSLPQEVFARYLGQDGFYLEAYFRGYAFAAARCEGRHDLAVVFYRLMGGALEELAMHADSAAELGLDTDRVEPLPAASAYVDLLLTTARRGELGEIVTVMTPCMRLYADLGRNLAGHRRARHPYRRWIDLYASPEMEELARRLEDLLDELAEDSPEIRALYRRAMRCELAFFDAII